jgi:hypothetical protein
MPKTIKTIIVLIALFVVLFLGYLYLRSTPEIALVTDKFEYIEGEYPKIKISNNTEETVCFSSCYPFYLERKDGEWVRYEYDKCREEEKANYCIEAGGSKTFEILTPYAEPGIHRVHVSACLSCEEGQRFMIGENYYSNDFKITNF